MYIFIYVWTEALFRKVRLCVCSNWSSNPHWFIILFPCLWSSSDHQPPWMVLEHSGFVQVMGSSQFGWGLRMRRWMVLGGKVGELMKVDVLDIETSLLDEVQQWLCRVILERPCFLDLSLVCWVSADGDLWCCQVSINWTCSVWSGLGLPGRSQEN